MREKECAAARMEGIPRVWSPKSLRRLESCSSRMLVASSGEHDSTAAEKVWRRQTPATTGFPGWIGCQDSGHDKDERRTGKEMLVYPCELYVCLCGVGDHEGVDDLGADDL